MMSIAKLESPQQLLVLVHTFRKNLTVCRISKSFIGLIIILVINPRPASLLYSGTPNKGVQCVAVIEECGFSI